MMQCSVIGMGSNGRIAPSAVGLDLLTFNSAVWLLVLQSCLRAQTVLSVNLSGILSVLELIPAIERG